MRTKYEIYQELLGTTINQFVKSEDFTLLPKLIFLGVKVICLNKLTTESTVEDLDDELELIGLILEIIETLTPREFMNIFPVEKKYNGEKYSCKDYYSTMDYIEGHGIDREILDAETFLIEYANHETHFLVSKSSLIINRILRLNGQETIAEKFLKENNIPIYKSYKDNKGNEFLIENGKSIKLEKPRKKSHLRLVK